MRVPAVALVAASLAQHDRPRRLAGPRPPAAPPPRRRRGGAAATKDVHGARRHVDVGGGLARRTPPRRRPAGQHLGAAGGRRRGHAHHRRLQRRAPAGLVARRPDDRVLRLSRRRLRPVGRDSRRHQPAQAHDRRLRRPRAGVVARRQAHRVLVRPRRPARQQLQHLDAGTRHRRARAAHEPSRPKTRCRAGRATTPTSRSSRRATAAGTCGPCRRRGGQERQVASSTGVVDAASWGPGGQIVAHVVQGTSSRLEVAGANITGTENVFPFRPSWASATEFFYTADGKIRKRTLGGAAVHRRAVHGHRCRPRRPAAPTRARSATSTRARRARRWASCGRCSRPMARRWRLPPWATSG